MADNFVRPALATSVALVDVNARAAERTHPRESTLALELLAEGRGFEDVSKQTGLTFSQIAALKARHKQPLEERRLALSEDGFEMAESLRLLAKKKIEALSNDEEALSKTSLKDLVIPWAVAQDKGFAALGEATKVVVEHRKGPSIEDAVAAIAEARAKLKGEDGDDGSIEVNVTPKE